MPIDHDQRFKTLIQNFLHDFFVLFFPECTQDFDMHHPEWLTTEVFDNPPDGTRRYLDLLAKVPITNPTLRHNGSPDAALALIHIEIEAKDHSAVAVNQLWENHIALRKKYQLPVVPVALFLKVGGNGVTVDEYNEHVGKLNTVTFRYYSVGLPKLDATEYLQKDNILGAALTPFMNIPDNEVVETGNEALLKIVNSDLSQQLKFLLAECVQKYLPLLPEDQALFEELQGTPRYIGVKAMNLTWEEKGILKGLQQGKIEGLQQGKIEGLQQGKIEGLQQGKIEGQLEMVKDMLTEKFGQLSPASLEKLNQSTLAQLRELSRKLLTANSLSALGLE